MIEVENLTKVYRMGPAGSAETEVRALRGVTLTIDQGEWVAIMGPSGSGKSTLMHVLSCLDTPTSGTYRLAGQDVSRMSEDELAAVRNRRIGFVFQSFNLLARAPALKQVMLPMQYARNGSRMPVGARRKQAEEALAQVGLAQRTGHQPSELSGGQQQRVAIARALAMKPSILMADEPTGNLDTTAGTEVLEIFRRLHAEQGITIVMVTHDESVAAQAQRVIRLRDGLVVTDERRVASALMRSVPAGEES